MLVIFFCLEARCVCRQAAVKAAKILPLVGLARSKQDPISRGHGAQYLYRLPPAGAGKGWNERVLVTKTLLTRHNLLDFLHVWLQAHISARCLCALLQKQQVLQFPPS